MGFHPTHRRKTLSSRVPITDEDAWVAYPAARAFYDRQWLAAQLGYVHGPAGTRPDKPGRYFIKPVRNLLGMGIGAAPVHYSPGIPFGVPPDYFWSECFTGEHLSIDYRWNRRARRWDPLCSVKGEFDGMLPLCWTIQPGRRLLPVLRGRTPDDWRSSMYYRYYHDPGDHNTRAHYGVRTARHKLIYFWTKDQWELFDLVTDPLELHNLYGQPGQEQLTTTLKAELRRLKKAVRDDDQFANEQPPNGVDGTVAKLRGK